MKNKWLSCALVAILAAGLFTGCGNNTDPAVSDDTNEPPINEVVIDEGENPVVGYDIGINAPKEWKGSTAIVQTDAKGEAVAAFGIELIIDGESQKGCYIAVISVFDETTWRDMPDAQKTGYSEMFATKGQMYVVEPGDNPFEEGTDAWQTFETMMKQYSPEMFYSTVEQIEL